ncbi:CapA family protein [Actimicrobium sp. CCC2.4]|uniref:CapA family protein n=1 Tax=Actimicrobium sp. CCC2.4 TaxID=3048606 RepID=UPI002AC9C62F|nr:CapA family protein [Actimicrobium sp. CCC2.4]MEB0133896.1 CapA family protein [Actimicrobium sp. CCC2.4]WPX31436.1 CapA family protein [Actimicrobium sp. CCC2.4]
MKRLAAILLCVLCLASGAQATEPVVSVAVVGDIMLAETPGKVVRSGRDPFGPFAAILAAADIRIGNLECVISTRGSPQPEKPYTFRAHPRTLPVIKRHFDAVALANNHSGDFGPLAFADMLGLLERQEIGYFGGGRDLAQAHRPWIVERKGLRIAFLSYNEFFPRSFEADTDKPGIAWSDDDQVRLDIVRARTHDHADLVIPVMHWGWEHEPTASKRQRELARLMIDAGADAVIGGHPHVTQDTGQYRNKPIIYSLGNFVFDGFSDRDNNTGWLLLMDLDRQGVRNWRTVVATINSEGIPYPARKAAGSCWERGQLVASACVKTMIPKSAPD